MLEALLSRAKLWRCTRVGAGVQVIGRVWAHGGSTIELGAGVLLDGSEAPIELRAANGGRLILGDGCVLRGGVSLEAEGLVRLGARVRVGAFAKVIDTHFHTLTGDRMKRPPPGSVNIEDDVVIEPYAIILPGAWLERGVHVDARAVVSKRIPAGARATGNPARAVK